MTSQAETFSRNRRLFDVRRGVVYLRRTENLAQHQWRHYGTVPAIKTHVIRDIGVTTRLSDVTASQTNASADHSLAEIIESEIDVGGSASDVKESISDVMNTEQPPQSKEPEPRTRVLQEFITYPQISVTEVVDTTLEITVPPAASGLLKDSPDHLSPEQQSQPSDFPPPASSSSISLPLGDLSPGRTAQDKDLPTNVSIPTFRQPLSTSKDDQHTFRQALAFPEGAPPEGAAFDTWGSRDWVQAEADLEPKSYAPKRYPIMSRVRGEGRKEGRKRQLRTLTDFRSGNGTLRVIRPVPPVPGAKRAPVLTVQEADDDDLDLDTLEREKTYAMLKRIDRLLEPSRAFFVSDLTSSQVELCPSTPSTSDLTDSLPDSQQQGEPLQQGKDQVHVHHDHFRKHLAENGGSDDVVDRHLDGMSGEGGPHQGYYDRIQARLARFYGHTDASGRQLKESSQERTTQRRGHSEPPHQRAEFFNDHSGQPSQGQNRYSHDQYGLEKGRRSVHDLQEALSPGAPRPGAAQSRMLPPLKNTRSGSRESLNDSRNRQHSHSWNLRAAKGRGRGSKGPVRAWGGGDRGKGWGTLSEVVKNLEKMGIDYHLKCQDWIDASFS